MGARPGRRPLPATTKRASGAAVPDEDKVVRHVPSVHRRPLRLVLWLTHDRGRAGECVEGDMVLTASVGRSASDLEHADDCVRVAAAESLPAEPGLWVGEGWAERTGSPRAPVLASLAWRRPTVWELAELVTGAWPAVEGAAS